LVWAFMMLLLAVYLIFYAVCDIYENGWNTDNMIELINLSGMLSVSIFGIVASEIKTLKFTKVYFISAAIYLPISLLYTIVFT
jgi:drug/metabolite transporter superfamily protein YnfA